MAWDDVELSSEPLQEDESWESWEEPREQAPPAIKGDYIGKIAEIREVAGPPTTRHFTAVMDYRIVGGVYDERLITFQRISSEPRTRLDGQKSSTQTDLFKCAGEERALSPAHARAILKRMKDQAKVFGFSWDWQATCMSCYGDSLVESTKSATVEEAKKVATREQKAKAGKIARLAKNYGQFPTIKGIDGTERKQAFVLCKKHAIEVPAMGQIQRYFKTEHLKEAPAAVVTSNAVASAAKEDERWS